MGGGPAQGIGSGSHLLVADVADLPARTRHHLLAHRYDQPRGGQERVTALRHRRRPRVVGEALEGDVVAVDADDPLHHADLDAGAVEDAALLDVQLDVAGHAARLEARLGDAAGIGPVPAQPFGQRHPVLVLRLQLARVRTARGHAAAENALAVVDAFFVRPDDHLEAMARRGLLVPQRGHHLERAHAPDVPVEVASFGHRVDVGAEQDRGQRGIGSRAPAVDVGRRVDPHVEPGLLHPLDEPHPGGLFLRGEAQAADTAFRVLAELGESEQQSLGPLAVDVERRVQSGAGQNHRGDHQTQAVVRDPHGVFFRDASRMRQKYQLATVR